MIFKQQDPRIVSHAVFLLDKLQYQIPHLGPTVGDLWKFQFGASIKCEICLSKCENVSLISQNIITSLLEASIGSFILSDHAPPSCTIELGKADTKNGTGRLMRPC